MTSISGFLFGFLTIFTAALCLVMRPVISGEIRATDIAWQQNRALRISLGIYVAIGAGVCMAASILTAPIIHRGGLSQYLLWASLSGAILAEGLILSGLGRLKLPIACCVAWALILAIWRGLV